MMNSWARAGPKAVGLIDTVGIVTLKVIALRARRSWNLPRAFVGFVLLPIVGNAAEHATAMAVAYSEKRPGHRRRSRFVHADRLIRHTSWSLAGYYGLDSDMTLRLSALEAAVTMLSVIIVAFQVQVGGDVLVGVRARRGTWSSR